MLELRSLAPVDCEVFIYECEKCALFDLSPIRELRRLFSPITAVYSSALAFASSAEFPEYTVTRTEYLESGSNACRKKFLDWKVADEKGKEKEKPNMKEDAMAKRSSKTKARSSTITNRRK